MTSVLAIFNSPRVLAWLIMLAGCVLAASLCVEHVARLLEPPQWEDVP